MEGEISVGQMILIVINILLTIVGFTISLMIKRLYESVDNLVLKDAAIQREVTEHREDVLKNYASGADLAALRDEFFKRFDRFEDNIMHAIRRIPPP